MKLLILIAGCCFAVCYSSMELEPKTEDAANVNVMESSHVKREKREASQVFSNGISSSIYNTRNRRAAVYTNRSKRQTDTLSADYQCAQALGEGSRFCPALYSSVVPVFVDLSPMCTTAFCLIPGTGVCQQLNNLFVDFTTCGNQKWCIANECVFDEAAPVTPSDLCPQGNAAGGACNFTPAICEFLRQNVLATFLDCCATCIPTTTTSTTTTTTTTSTTSTTTPTTTTSTTTPTTTTSITTPTTTTSTTTPTTTTMQSCTLFRYLKCKCSNPPMTQLKLLRKSCRRCLRCRSLFSKRRCRQCKRRKCSNPPKTKLKRVRKSCRRCLRCRSLFSKKRCRQCKRRKLKRLCYLLAARDKN